MIIKQYGYTKAYCSKILVIDRILCEEIRDYLVKEFPDVEIPQITEDMIAKIVQEKEVPELDSVDDKYPVYDYIYDYICDYLWEINETVDEIDGYDPSNMEVLND